MMKNLLYVSAIKIVAKDAFKFGVEALIKRSVEENI
jgi:hypothetical protein